MPARVSGAAQHKPVMLWLCCRMCSPSQQGEQSLLWEHRGHAAVKAQVKCSAQYLPGLRHHASRQHLQKSSVIRSRECVFRCDVK